MEDVPYGRILREGWVIILIVALLGAGSAWAFTKFLPETYAASSTLLLRVDSKEASLFERNQFSLARIKSYPALVDSPEVVDAVRTDLALKEKNYSDRDIRRLLSAENTADTVLLVVRADGPTAEFSAELANSAAKHLSELIRQTENDADERYIVSLDQVLPAVEPLAPVSPQVTAITGLGGIAGLALGSIIAVYRTTTNRRLRTISDIRRATGLPVIGLIPRKPRIKRNSDSPVPVAFEETLGNMIALAGTHTHVQVLVPAEPSGIDDDTVRGLLAAQDSIGVRACAIDARAITGFTNSNNLNDVINGTYHPPTSAAEGIVFTEHEPISLDELTKAIPNVLTELSKEFGVIYVVTDPGRASLLAALAEAGSSLMITVRHNATSAASLVAVATRLRVMGISPVGVLMINTGNNALGTIADSWRVSDRERHHAGQN